MHCRKICDKEPGAGGAAVPVFNEITFVQFMIWSIMLFLMLWYVKNAGYGL